ncbi:MAG: molybdenum cofactor guanylyltransferase [Desulfohalobiaceae bacterium]
MDDRRPSPLAGVVLAGGKSTRLGQDKARIKVAGLEMLHRTVQLLSSFTSELWVVGRDPGPMLPTIRWALDERPGLGPVGGICTALRCTRKPCLVLSCDLPFLDRETLEKLVGQRAKRTPDQVMTTFQQVETGYIESLVAIYEPEALGLMEEAVGQGIYKLSRIFTPERRCHIPYTHDQALPFFNINHPAELALMRKLAEA